MEQSNEIPRDVAKRIFFDQKNSPMTHRKGEQDSLIQDFLDSYGTGGKREIYIQLAYEAAEGRLHSLILWDRRRGSLTGKQLRRFIEPVMASIENQGIVPMYVYEKTVISAVTAGIRHKNCPKDLLISICGGRNPYYADIASKHPSLGDEGSVYMALRGIDLWTDNY